MKATTEAAAEAAMEITIEVLVKITGGMELNFNYNSGNL